MWHRIAALVLSAALWSRADTLILKDGRRFAGTITTDTGKVRIKVKGGKVYTFTTGEVGKMEIDHPAPREKGTPAAQETTLDPPLGQAAVTPGTKAVPSEPPKTPPPGSITVPEVGNSTSESIPGASAIDSEFTARGSDNGVLGPPRAPTQPTADGRAAVRFFTRGAIYWTSTGGGRAI